MATASIYTGLSLNRYASILGINPMHFAGASADEYFPLRTRCSDIWQQHSWQFADSVSREDLALAIDEAEQDIARELGFWPYPKWFAQEVHQTPRFHRREYFRQRGFGVRAVRTSVTADFGRIIQAGVRAVTKVGTATLAAGMLTYTDADGDGFRERATITLPTTYTDVSGLKVYQTGEGGVQVSEIRDPHYRATSDGAITFYFWAWQLIDPALWEIPPHGLIDQSPVAIDLAGLAEVLPDYSNLVDSVDVYREYTTSTDEPSAEFYWEPLPGCEPCELATQTGCLHVRDANLGIVVPSPATYSDDDEEWQTASWAESREPDFVKIWYRAGFLDGKFLAGRANPANYTIWDQPVAWLATARLERPFCSCGNVTALGNRFREDLAFVGESSHQVDPLLLSNPFGTLRGEVMAWQKVNRARGKVPRGGAI